MATRSGLQAAKTYQSSESNIVYDLVKPLYVSGRTLKKQTAEAKSTLDRVPDVGIGMLLRSASLEYNRVLRANLSEHGVTFSEFQHLWRLWEEDGLSQVELAGRLGMPKAASTSVLDGLEARGFIKRQRDDVDKRRLLIKVTVEGRAVRTALTTCAQKANDVARQGFNDADVLLLFSILTGMTSNLKAALA